MKHLSNDLTLLMAISPPNSNVCQQVKSPVQLFCRIFIKINFQMSGNQTRLPIFELDGDPAAEGSFDLEVSEPSLCGGEEVSILAINVFFSFKF